MIKKLNSLLLDNEKVVKLENEINFLYNDVFSEINSKRISEITNILSINRSLSDYLQLLLILEDEPDEILSNITITCQSERSQIQNKNTAMKILRSRLEKLKEEKELKDKNYNESKKSNNSFGNQIRTYTFNPYQLVKDHRTNVEDKNINSVMDGNINKFIESYLLSIKEVV